MPRNCVQKARLRRARRLSREEDRRFGRIIAAVIAAVIMGLVALAVFVPRPAAAAKPVLNDADCIKVEKLIVETR